MKKRSLSRLVAMFCEIMRNKKKPETTFGVSLVAWELDCDLETARAVLEHGLKGNDFRRAYEAREGRFIIVEV